MTTTRVPALGAEGWFSTDTGRPALIGRRCQSCGSVSFPPRSGTFCTNPDCDGTEFEAVELSRQGTIWSYTDAQYQPPPPYVPAGAEHQPFAIAAVELAEEGLVVMGQMAPGISVDDLAVGQPVELVVDVLFADDDHEYLVWKWRPV